MLNEAAAFTDLENKHKIQRALEFLTENKPDDSSQTFYNKECRSNNCFKIWKDIGTGKLKKLDGDKRYVL